MSDRIGAMSAEQRSNRKGIRIACLAVTAVLPAVADAAVCAPPAPWTQTNGLQAQVQACLRGQAWETRNLTIPIGSVVSGIVAQCEVRVIFNSGPAGSASRARAQQLIDANDRLALDEALDDVTWARRCAGQ